MSSGREINPDPMSHAFRSPRRAKITVQPKVLMMIDFAERVVAALKDVEAKGHGSMAFGGQLLDKPIVDRARATLALGARLAAAAKAPGHQGEANANR